MPNTASAIDESLKFHTPRRAAVARTEAAEDTAAHTKRRWKKARSEVAGGRRRRSVGAYRTATYETAMAAHAATAAFPGIAGGEAGWEPAGAAISSGELVLRELI